MARLSVTAAALMKRYDAHAATDVTGFGILGHAENLAKHQRETVAFEIHTLPIIRKMKEVNSKFNFKLTDGYSAETSGGLLVALPAANAQHFLADIERMDGCPAWIVGRVVSAGERGASLSDDLTILEV
mmetsp:Transcript_11207/g.29555  ORF Transcript_11207/g.29555 Transcript_11207/m.29555 type:complete len:129 (-) Transcript_11207:199-585(-)